MNFVVPKPAAPTAPGFDYSSLGLQALKVQRKMQSSVFDKISAGPKPSLLQQAIQGLTTQKSLLGG